MCSKRFQLSRQTYTYLKKKTGLSGRQTAQSKLLPAYQSVLSNAPDDEKKQIKQYRWTFRMNCATNLGEISEIIHFCNVMYKTAVVWL